MKIELKYPFTDEWTHAYLVSSQGRNTVCLYNNKENERKSLSYARYLMSCKLKRHLNKNEEVDHIDDNKANDSINNLQILTPQENIRKTARKNGVKVVKYECPVCLKEFIKRKGNSHHCSKQKSFACSKKCSSEILKNKAKYEPTIRIVNEYVDHTGIFHEDQK